VAGIYRKRHPERTVFYRVLFHYFEQFLSEYESRFEREYGYFHKISRFNESLIGEFFSREVFSMLLHKGLINLELVEKILSWHHTGFNVHSKVRATTKREAERIGKYMIRPLLSLKRLSIDETEGKVCYQYGKDSSELEQMNYLIFF